MRLLLQKNPIEFLINHAVDSDTARWMVFHLSFIIFDLLLVLGIYLVVKKYAGQLWALVAAALYGVNPILYYASGQWGQADSAVILSILLIFYLLWTEKYFWILPSVALSILFKPTIIALLPFILLIMLFKKQYKSIVFGTIISIIITLVFSLPFFGINLVKIVGFYYSTLIKNDLTPQLAVGAKSLWFLFGEKHFDSIKFLGLSYKNIGLLLFLLTSFLAAWLPRKTKNRFLALSLGFSAVSFALYFLLTRSHERYQLFSFLPLIFLIIEARTRIWASILYLLSTITFALVIMGIYWGNNTIWQKISMSGNAIVLINLAIFLAVIGMLWYYGADGKKS